MFRLFNRRRRSTSFADTRFLVIDLEMTGLNPEEDSIISAGTVFVEGGRVILASAEHHYFLPTSLMGDDVSRSAHIHLITDSQREQQGESLQVWLTELSTRLAADAWVFHHAPIDLPFLRRAAQRMHIALPKVRIVDTLTEEKKRRPDDYLDSHAQLNLNSCRARYGLPVYRQHHALSDALATAELWLAQQQHSG